MLQISYYATREEAIAVFNEKIAKGGNVRNASLLSSNNTYEDLKIDGITVCLDTSSSAPLAKGGSWEIWDLSGELGNGKYAYDSAIANRANYG
jgi:hypothetical protein